jgi:hypothetical protein
MFRQDHGALKTSGTNRPTTHHHTPRLDIFSANTTTASNLAVQTSFVRLLLQCDYVLEGAK